MPIMFGEQGGMMTHRREQFPQRASSSAICVTAAVALFWPHQASAQNPSSIDLIHVLAPAHPCWSFSRPVQFLTETELVVLSGSGKYCYQSVDQVALNLISTDGKLLTRRAWSSSESGTVIDSDRLVFESKTGLEVDNRTLAPIQSLSLPPHRGLANFSLRRQGAVDIRLDGQKLRYAGTPLHLVGQSDAPPLGSETWGFELESGETIKETGGALVLKKQGQPDQPIGSLEWVIPPCGRFTNCQEYDAGTQFDVSTGKKRRILVVSNGSHFPITDAAGLFPYFRLEVFDLDSKKSLYREEHVFRTGQRSAAISPDGDRLATTDGEKIVIRNLP